MKAKVDESAAWQSLDDLESDSSDDEAKPTERPKTNSVENSITTAREDDQKPTNQSEPTIQQVIHGM